MTQPDCGEDWVGCLAPPSPPPDPTLFEDSDMHEHRPAAIFVAALLVAVLIFDVWALRRRRRQKRTRTISQMTQDLVKRFGPWFAALLAGLLVALGWHLLRGFP